MCKPTPPVSSLRTQDNLHVRIPNDVMLRAQVTTLTRYEIRRFDLDLQLDFDTDLTRLKEVLLEVSETQATTLEEPRPLFKFVGFSDIGIRVQICTWTARDKFLTYKVTFATAVKKALDKHGFRFATSDRVLRLGPAESGDTPSASGASSAEKESPV